jgi:EAL domain-containing protein (putative c-di-GMP-specific phosphodiesterase class I)
MLSTLADDSITLHYQPLVKSDGDVIGFESLMRWHHQQRGHISPEAFIPIFEDCGLIVSLSRWALRQACLDATSWRRPLQVSVNLSPAQFQQDDLPALVAEVLADTGLAPERLELEMTEAALLADPQGAASTLRKLSARGVRIAFDNAGGGVALPFFLKDYPFSRVKIARDVVSNIETSQSARSIVHMILLVGRSMNVPVAAKGVETGAQLAYLVDQGCDLIQGFLVGRPAALTSFAALTGNSQEEMASGSTGLPPGSELLIGAGNAGSSGWHPGGTPGAHAQ